MNWSRIVFQLLLNADCCFATISLPPLSFLPFPWHLVTQASQSEPACVRHHPNECWGSEVLCTQVGQLLQCGWERKGRRKYHEQWGCLKINGTAVQLCRQINCFAFFHLCELLWCARHCVLQLDTFSFLLCLLSHCLCHFNHKDLYVKEINVKEINTSVFWHFILLSLMAVEYEVYYPTSFSASLYQGAWIWNSRVLLLGKWCCLVFH